MSPERINHNSGNRGLLGSPEMQHIHRSTEIPLPSFSQQQRDGMCTALNVASFCLSSSSCMQNSLDDILTVTRVSSLSVTSTVMREIGRLLCLPASFLILCVSIVWSCPLRCFPCSARLAYQEEEEAGTWLESQAQENKYSGTPGTVLPTPNVLQ